LDRSDLSLLYLPVALEYYLGSKHINKYPCIILYGRVFVPI